LDPKAKEADHRPDLSERRVVAETVMEVDPLGKALTGRTPERLEDETGIPKEELFPDGKDVVYIGDPWQRMGTERDNPHTFIVDYEFGETAEFIDNPEAFLDRMLPAVSGDSADDGELALPVGNSCRQHGEYQLAGEKEDLTSRQKKWLEQFLELIKKANDLTRKLDRKKFEDFGPVADAWGEARFFIETTYKQEMADTEESLPSFVGDPRREYDPLSEFRKQAWYDCVYAERGFRDIPDWLTKVEPRLKERRIELETAGKDEEEIEKTLKTARKILIDHLRLRRKPEEANVIQAVFPELPFRDGSFDRLVASWSISAHVFSHLDRTGFNACWQEIRRVLKDEGKAYIFPLDYEQIDEEEFFASLREFAEKTGLKWKVLDDRGQPVDGEHLAETLLLEKNVSI